jgi:D-3-phosphoglycerate dehydrogenase
MDCAAAKARAVIVENTPGNANAVAELSMGLMIMIARGKYSGKSGTELRGKKLGVHALGNVGKIVASLGKAFGMDVCAFDPFVEQCVFDDACVGCVQNLDELYSSCDYISLHIPATPETIKSINHQLLSKMKKGGTLINTARAEVIHEEDLLRVLNKDRISSMHPTSPKECRRFHGKVLGPSVFHPQKNGGADR